MKHIPLSKGAVALVDDDLYDELITVSWSLNSSGYAIHWYTNPKTGKRSGLLMHRYIMDAPPHLQVDHQDRNRLNNTRANLRFATKSQNQANKNIPKNNTSSFKGDVWNKGKYEARIGYKGRKIHLGRFINPEIAAANYDAAARKLFGDFAGVNFPDLDTPPRIAKLVEQRLHENVLRADG